MNEVFKIDVNKINKVETSEDALNELWEKLTDTRYLKAHYGKVVRTIDEAWEELTDEGKRHCEEVEEGWNRDYRIAICGTNTCQFSKIPNVKYDYVGKRELRGYGDVLANFRHSITEKPLKSLRFGDGDVLEGDGLKYINCCSFKYIYFIRAIDQPHVMFDVYILPSDARRKLYGLGKRVNTSDPTT